MLALAALSKFYMYDQLAVVPTNNQSTSISGTPAGEDAEYIDIAAGLKITTGPLKSTRIVTGDVKASKQASKDLNRDIAVWNTYKCTAPPEFDCGSSETPLSAVNSIVAFDRNTGETVNWKGTKNETSGETTSPAGFKGLYYKFPFDTQKKTYKFWDDGLGTATAAKYVGEGKVKGLKVYKFKQTIEPTKTGTIDVPGDLVGSKEATVTADRMYVNVRSFSVEPVTGVILIGAEEQDAYLAVAGERKATATKAHLVYTDQNTTDVVDKYKPKAKLLSAVKTTVPVGGAVLGLLLIGFGLWTKRGAKNKTPGNRNSGAAKVPIHK